MKKLIYIAMQKIKLTFRDKTALIWMFAAPLIFMVILVFGFGGGGNSEDIKYPINVVNSDASKYSTELINMLKGEKSFQIIESNYAQAKEAVQAGKSLMGVIIPEGFSKAIEEGSENQLELLKLQDNEGTMALTLDISNYINQIKIGEGTGSAVVETLSSMKVIKVEENREIKERVQSSFNKNMNNPSIVYSAQELVNENKPGLDGLSSTAIGILIIFIMFFVTSGAASMFEEKEIGTWNRIVSTPTRDYSIVGGFILGNFILGWIQIGMLIVVSRYLFNINWGNSIMGLIILFSTFLLAIIGFGVSLASFVKSKAQLSSLTSIIVMPTCLLAGCMWPRDVMPDIMIKISNFIPQTWVLTGMADLVSRGSSINAIYFPSAVLLIFAAIFFTIGLNFMNLQKN